VNARELTIAIEVSRADAVKSIIFQHCYQQSDSSYTLYDDMPDA